jgi:hypothetical protein
MLLTDAVDKKSDATQYGVDVARDVLKKEKYTSYYDDNDKS